MSTADTTTPPTSPPSPTERAPGLRDHASAALIAALVSALVLGVIDAAYAAWKVLDAEHSAGESVLLAFYDAGLLVPLTWVVAAVVATALAWSPWDVGPRGALSALKTLVTARGDEGARLSARLWGAGAGLVVTYGVLFKLSHVFMLTFKNQTLSSLLLAMIAMGWMGAMIGVTAKLIQGLEGVMKRLGGLGRPLVPAGLAVAVATAGAIGIPIRFHETWEALDLRAPVMGMVMVVLVWAMTGLGAKRVARVPRAKGLGAGVVALGVALLGLFVPTLTTFGQSADHSGMVYTLTSGGPLSRVSLTTLQKRFDADKDGYASRLGGGDCDDTNPKINPSRDEIMANGIDEDCDGKDLDPLPLTASGGGGPLGSAPTAANTPGAGDPNSPRTDATAPSDPLGPWRKKYNVVMIIADTVRWDRLSYAGYARKTSPNLDKVAKRATIFENAYSVSAKTPTAIAPIMAGRYPSEMHRNFKHFTYYDDENVFLAEKLQEQGYLTAASGGHWYFQRKYGFGQGFMRWRSYKVKGDKMERIPTSSEITDNAIEMIDALAAGKLPAKGDDDEGAPDAAPPAPKDLVGANGKRPWFFFLHYFDPHKHYIDHEGFEPFGSKSSDRYDGEIRFMDHHFGRLLATLERHDPGLKNTVILFMSDHGEAFGEHNMRFHGWDLFEHQIRAPYFIYVPGAPAQRIKERVSIMDSLPTIVDLLGVEGPKVVRGGSLVPYLVGDKKLEPNRPIFTEMPPGPYNPHYRSLTVGRWKLIHRLMGNHYRLFDLEKDPGEERDVMKSNAEQAKTMKETYQRFRATQLDARDARKD